MGLIVRKELKKRILQRWEQKRPGHEMTRVAKSTLDHVEITAEMAIEKEMERICSTHPSVGKTIMVD